MGGMFDSMCSDLAGIKMAAETAKTCLVVAHPSSDTVSNLSVQLPVETNGNHLAPSCFSF